MQDKNVTNIVIVGDAFARPMLDALDRAEDSGNPYDINSVQAIISSGVMWSSEVKNGLLKHHDMKLMDTMGSTEGGIGSSIATRDNPSETAKFSINPGVIVLADDGEILEPGSKKIGLLGTSGLVPVGYYKDEKKSAETLRRLTVLGIVFLETMQNLRVMGASPFLVEEVTVLTQQAKRFILKK